MLWWVLPLIEDLQDCWEKKCDGKAGFKRFSVCIPCCHPRWTRQAQEILHQVWREACLCSSFEYIHLFLSLNNQIICTTVLHPYFKLEYIKLAWGGEAERAAEWAKGILDAKNWQDEALQVFKQAVHLPAVIIPDIICHNTKITYRQKYIGSTGLK